MGLTAATLRALKPEEKIYRRTDGHNLYIEVRPNGSKLWFFKYRFAKKEKRLSLGSFPEVTLASARERRDSERKKLRDGSDPSHARKLAKMAAQVGAEHTFEAVAEDYVRARMIGRGAAQSTIDKARWALKSLNSTIGNRPLAEIEPAEILSCLQGFERKGHYEKANRCRSLASSVFRFGIANTLCKSDPASPLRGALSVRKVRHHPAIIDPVELGNFLREVDEYSGGPIVRLAMLIIPHVFLRPGELRSARWDEIDWENAIWTIPEERTKLRRPHKSPLSRQVLDYLRELQVHTSGFELMFPGRDSHPSRSAPAQSCRSPGSQSRPAKRLATAQQPPLPHSH